MPGATFCPKCNKRLRSERHVCQPSALQKKERMEDEREAAASSES